MRTSRKLIALVLLGLPSLSACAMAPEKPTESTVFQPQLVPSMQLERIAISDNQGVSIYDIVVQNGRLISMNRSNEASTSEQDMANIAAGAAAGPLVNNIGAGIREEINRQHCDSGCGGKGTTIQVLNESYSGGSSAGASANSSAGAKAGSGTGGWK